MSSRPSFDSSKGSTYAGSSDFIKESPRGTAERHQNRPNFYNEGEMLAPDRMWERQAYEQQAMAYMHQPHYGYGPHAPWHAAHHQGFGDDSISMTSFNSSMNFTRL